MSSRLAARRAVRLAVVAAVAVAVQWHTPEAFGEAGGDAGVAASPPPVTMSESERAAALAGGTFVPEVSIATANGPISIGRGFVVFIRVVYEAGTEVSLPGSLQLGDDLEELRRTSTTHRRSDGRWVRDFEVELIPWVLGPMAIPPISLSYALGGRAQTLVTEALMIEVGGLIGDGPEQLRTLAPTVDVMAPAYRNLIYAAVALLIVLGLALLVWIRRRRRAGADQAAHTAAVPVDDRYLQLVELENSGRLLGAEARAGWEELAEISRALVSDRHGIPGEWTTGETAAWLKSSGKSEPLVDEVLAHCDLVKFADARPTPTTVAAALAVAKARSRFAAVAAVQIIDDARGSAERGDEIGA